VPWASHFAQVAARQAAVRQSPELNPQGGQEQLGRAMGCVNPSGGGLSNIAWEFTTCGSWLHGILANEELIICVSGNGRCSTGMLKT